MSGPRILVVRFGALGDVILTTPLLRALRRVHPTARLTMVTKRAYLPVLAHNPHLDDVVTLEPGESIRSLARRLAGARWDHRLDLHGSLRSRVLRFLLGGRWRGYPKQRTRRALLLRLGVDSLSPGSPVAERYFVAARDLGARPDGEPAEVVTAPTDDARAATVVGDGPYVALAPGSRHWNKRWPAEHWRALAPLLADQGLAPVGVGTDAERPFLAGTAARDGFGLSLGATAAVLRGARVVVANDSGLMHLATAVRAPVVALFGPTSRAFGFAPYRARALVLERPLPCRPCSAYGGPHCPRGHHRCMIDLEPADVAAAVLALA